MPMFNTVAIRIQPQRGATRFEFVRDATHVATQLGVSVSFDWNGVVEDFVIHPHTDVDANFKRLGDLFDTLTAHQPQEDLATPLPSSEEKQIADAGKALAALKDMESGGDR